MKDKISLVLKRLLCALSIIIVSSIHFQFNIYRYNMHNLSTKMDNLIPFKEIFVLPYLYWFAYVSLILIYFAFNNGEAYFRLLGSIVLGMGICELVFYFFPTTVPRPTIYSSSILNQMVKFVYSVDNPYDCFPSIHVLNAMLVTIFFCKYTKNIALKSASIISCILICLSTLYIKQHYVLDVISACALALIMYKLFTIKDLKINRAFVNRNSEL